MSTSGCDFNRSMQHLISNCREGDVENEKRKTLCVQVGIPCRTRILLGADLGEVDTNVNSALKCYLFTLNRLSELPIETERNEILHISQIVPVHVAA